MDNKEKLNQWILEHSNELELKVTRATWTKDWLPQAFDYRTSITVDGKVYNGRGIAKDEQLAFTKSVCEAIERSVCDSHGIRSNGIAVHTTFDRALENAKLELIERDIFLCHHLTKSSFHQFCNFEKYLYLIDVKRKLKIHGFELRISENRAQDLIFIFVEIVNDSYNRFVGLKVSSCEGNAIFGALTESLSNVVAFIDDEDKYRESFADDNDLGPRSHQFIHNAGIVPRLHIDLLEPRTALENINLNSIDGEQLVIKNDILKTAPIYVAKASSNDLQKMFYGTPEPKDINFKRLEQFMGRELSFKEIEDIPHPIG